MGRIATRPLGAVGAGAIVVGCGAMTAMLPGAAASVLGVLGLGGSSVVGRALASASKPLFVVSAVLLIVAGLACSWLATLTATGGSLLLYLGMFVLLDHDMGSSSMAGTTDNSVASTARTRHSGCRQLQHTHSRRYTAVIVSARPARFVGEAIIDRASTSRTSQ